MPNGVIMPNYYILEYPTWVNVFALTKDEKVVMVRQYRHGLGITSLEIPGGCVDGNETPEAAARREMQEETGYTFERYEYLGRLSANPATSNNYTYFYLATGGELTGSQNLDHTEDIEVELYTIDEVRQMLQENSIQQALHTSTIFYALQKLGKLY